MNMIGCGYLTAIPSTVPDAATVLHGGWGVSGAVSPEGKLQIWGQSIKEYEGVDIACLGWQTLYFTIRDDPHLHVIPTTPSGPSQPILLQIPRWTRVRQMAAGEGHVLCLMEDGNVWSWGENRNGCLGTGCRDATMSLQCVLGPGCEEEELLAMEPVRCVASGMVHSCAVTQRGVVFCWGCNLHGECGQVSKQDILSPQQVKEMGGVEIQSLSAGLHHTMALSVSGDVYGWGSNADGQLGLAEQIVYPLPALVDAPQLEHVDLIKVCCGARHTMVLSKQGAVYGWGWNAFQQVSNQIQSSHISEPNEVEQGCQDIAAGHWHSIILKSSHS